AITFGALANKTLGDPDFAVSATSSSGLSVSFSAAGNCTVSGNTVHLSSAGSCTITASQAGNSNYNAATSVNHSFTTATPSADLSITISGSPILVNTGDNITYTVSVKNNGPSPATGVVLTETLNQSLKFVSASAGCTQSGATVTCNIGALANGATSTKTIVV